MSQLLHPYLWTHDRDVFDKPLTAQLPPTINHDAPDYDFPRDDSPESHDLNERPVNGFEDAVRQLFHMTLASLRGYREIGHLTSNQELHTFVDVVARQRGAQCRALAQMSHSLYRQLSKLGPEDDSLADPGAADLQLVWLRAIWSLEQEEFGRFADNIEQAESMLEDAFLTAASTFKNAGVATICRQFAMNICGVRQRLEELTDTRVLDQ